MCQNLMADKTITSGYKDIKARLYLLSALFSALLVIILYIVCGIFPFGGRSVLTGDMGRQFAPFYFYFKEVILETADFSYTFMKTLGGDMPGFSAYYLNNPLLLVLFLFPGEKLAVGIELLILLQVTLCGLSASILLNNINRPSYRSLIFSTAYAGIGFIYSYFVLTIYFSNLALLPIAVLFYLKFLDKNCDRAPFILTSALYIFMSYYLGYMLMLFFAIIFISRLIKDSIYIKRLPELIFCLAVTLCIDGAFLFMTAYSLRGEKSSLSADLSFYRRFRLTDLFSGFFSGNSAMTQDPVVYCSVAAFCFMLLYFAGRRPLREKISSLFILLALSLSMWINTLDAVWHGFNNPVGFPYRYAYLLSGAVIVIGYKGYLDAFENFRVSDGNEKRRIFIPFAVTLALLLFLFLFSRSHMPARRLAVNIAIVLLVVLSVFIGLYRKYPKAAFLLCLAVTFADLSLSSVSSYLAYNADGDKEELPLLSDFYDAYEGIGKPIEYIKEYDKGIYRIEKDFYRTPNDPMLFGYIGLSHYSSCEKEEVRHYMERMGFRDTGIYASYNLGSTAFADCLLGVRYYVSRFDETYKPYAFMEQAGDYYIYNNPYALPLAFPSDRMLRKLDIDAQDIFETQNKIAAILSGSKEEKLYVPALFDKAVSEDEIVYTVHIEDRIPLYFYFDSEKGGSMELYVNGEDRGPYFTDTNWSVLNAGLYDKGTELEIVLRRLEGEPSVSDECFYYEDAQAIEKWHESVSRQNKQAEIEMKRSSKLCFDMEAKDHSYIVMSIPYAEGWKIRVDGEEVSPDKVLGALLAIPTGKALNEEGSFHVEMKYVPEGFFPGIYFTVFGLLIVLLDIYMTKRRMR